MKKIILSILIANSIIGAAQDVNTNQMQLSLQQAIETGLKNRYDVQAKRYNVTLSKSEVVKAKKEWIPEISGTGNMRYSPDIQATYIPGGFFGQDASLVALGAKSMAVFGLELNQPIFKPGIVTDVKIAKNHAALSEEKNKQDENTIKEQILIAYLNVLLKNLQYKIAIGEEFRFKEYASLAEGKQKLGTILETDYLKAKLDYENAKVESQKLLQNYQLAISNIKYQINLPETTVIVLSDTIDSPNLNKFYLQNKGDAENRTEIKQLILKQEAAKLDLKKTRQGALPSLALYGNYSKQFTYTNLDYSLGRWWSTFNFVGLQLRVPITYNFKNYNTIEERKISSIQTELELKQKLSEVNYEIQKAETEINNAQQNIQTTKSNYELSKVIYENQKKQFDLGAKPYGELLETNRSLSLAEQNYIKAVYDYLIASVNYKKATGSL